MRGWIPRGWRAPAPPARASATSSATSSARFSAARAAAAPMSTARPACDDVGDAGVDPAGMGGGAAAGAGCGDMCGAAFGEICGGGRGGRSVVYRAADLRYSLEIALEQSAHGFETKIRLPPLAECV